MTFETRTVPPAVSLVTPAEAKAQLRIEHSDDDALIGSLVVAASRAVERMTGRALITQTWRQDLGWAFREKDVLLRRTPVQSLVSIEYYDGANVLQSADLADFRLYGADARWFVRPEPGAEWPELYSRPDALRITYVAGYGDSASDVPQELRTAALMLVAHWYQRAEAVTEGASTEETPMGVGYLIEPHRSGWLAS